jgi:hypothetical protein
MLISCILSALMFLAVTDFLDVIRYPENRNHRLDEYYRAMWHSSRGLDLYPGSACFEHWHGHLLPWLKLLLGVVWLSLHGRSKVNRVRKCLALLSVWVESECVGHHSDPVRQEEGLQTWNPVYQGLLTNLLLRYRPVGFFSVLIATSQV